jgi:hypothetical protein
LAFALSALATSLFAGVSLAEEWKSGIPWQEPKVVDPGQPGKAPSDAIILFDGKDMSEWVGAEQWIVKDGCVMTHAKDYSTIHSKKVFGDCQVHLEWASPAKVEGHGQERGNSGIFLMGLYEVQILDSYQNPTYFDGQAAAVYKQHPPLVNACRKPGEWQAYDILFEAPRFDSNNGKLTRPAFVTVLQNGVVVQNHFQIKGGTAWDRAPSYAAHAAKLPLALQYHFNPVRFRNIWVRELPPADAPEPSKTK